MKYLATALVIAGLASAAGCGSEGAVDQGAISDAVTTPPSVPAGSTPSSGGEQPPVDEMTYQVWLTRGETLWPALRSSPQSPAVGAAAVRALLDGPSDEERARGLGSAVPDGTSLLGLAIDNGVATVDLSSEYESGGGSLSMTMRLAQLVYTLTQFPTVKKVAFELDGRPVDVFSGEGLLLDRPQTRKDYESVLPVIAVFTPAPGQQAASPLRVTGLANVFEANVTVELLDRSGKVIAKDFTTATCGTGCWGSFKIDLPFEVSERTDATLLVHDDDAAGTGTPPHQVEIPVVLTSG